MISYITISLKLISHITILRQLISHAIRKECCTETCRTAILSFSMNFWAVFGSLAYPTVLSYEIYASKNGFGVAFGADYEINFLSNFIFKFALVNFENV